MESILVQTISNAALALLFITCVHCYLRTRHVNQIWLEILTNLRSLHFWKITCQGDLIVQRKGESERVLNAIAKHFLGQFLGGRFVVNRQNIHLITRLAKEFQHFLETIGIAANVCKGSGFHHETHLARRIATQRRRIGRLAHGGQSRHFRWRGEEGRKGIADSNRQESDKHSNPLHGCEQREQ